MANENKVTIGDVEMESEELTYDMVREGVSDLSGVAKNIAVVMKSIDKEEKLPDTIKEEVAGMEVSMASINSDISAIKSKPEYSKLGIVDLDGDVDAGMEFLKTIQDISDVNDKLTTVSDHLFIGIFSNYADDPTMTKILKDSIDNVKGE